MFSCMYIAPGQEQITVWWQSFDVNRKPNHFDLLLQISKWSLWILILYTFLKIKILMSTESSYHFNHLLQVSQKSLWILILYTFFNVFPYVYSPWLPGQGQTTLCGQNSDVNRKALSLCPSVASFKKISLKSDSIQIFVCFYTCI